MKIKYRPEIDGLRAISVLAVIFYHLEFLTKNNDNFFKGGFVGVDIFFVISGYLITSIIYKEIILTNKLSFKDFYIRRIRRIVPVLLFVIITSIIISIFYSLPTPLLKFSESILYSTFFAGNFYFFFENIDYGDNHSNLLPFLHTWSLSIEEQYYIIFPLFLLLLYKYYKKNIILIFLIIFFLSITINQIGKSYEQLHALSFYMFPFRAWEILSGCIIAIYENKIKKKILLLPQLIPLVAILIIFFSIFFFDFENIKPVPQLLLIIISTSIILWYSNKEIIVNKILSNKYLVKIGLISFSLYLWHFPIFAIFRQNDIHSELFIQNNNKILLFILTIFLSIISYKIVEKPFRNKKIKISFLKNYIIFCLLIIVSFSIYTNHYDGIKQRYENFYTQYNHYEIDNRYLKQKWQKPLKGFYSKNASKFTDNNKTKIIFIGNSHAVGYFNSFNLNKKLFPKYEFSILRIGLKDLNKYKNQFSEFLKSDYIFIGTRYDFSLVKNDNLTMLENFVEDWINFAKENNKKLIFILNRPEFKWNSYNNYTKLDEVIYYKIINGDNLENFKEEISKYYFDIRRSEVSYFNEKLKKILKEKKVGFLDPADYSCENIKNKCDTLTDFNEKIYWDYGHYTIRGAKYFGKKIAEMNWLKLR